MRLAFKLLLFCTIFFHQTMGYCMGEMSAFDSSLLEENYSAFIGEINFPISDFMETIEITEITNKAKKGIDANHFVTGTSYVELKVPSVISGREIISADLEKIGNKLNKAILGGRGCSLFIHSYAPGEADFKIMLEVSVPKKIFNSINYDKDQRISKIQSDILLKKCIRTTLRNESFNMKVSLPVRLGLKPIVKPVYKSNLAKNDKINPTQVISNP